MSRLFFGFTVKSSAECGAVGAGIFPSDRGPAEAAEMAMNPSSARIRGRTPAVTPSRAGRFLFIHSTFTGRTIASYTLLTRVFYRKGAIVELLTVLADLMTAVFQAGSGSAA
ncbi:hypothetical protein [Nocardia sp. NPDC004750]